MKRKNKEIGKCKICNKETREKINGTFICKKHKKNRCG